MRTARRLWVAGCAGLLAACVVAGGAVILARGGPTPAPGARLQESDVRGGIAAPQPRAHPVSEHAPNTVDGLPAWGTKTLKDIALKELADNDDPVPAMFQYVLTDRGVGEANLSGANVDSDGGAYVIAMHGHFTAKMGFLPYGVAAPTGSTLRLDVDATTGGVTDMGISNLPYADLARLGAVWTVRP